MLATQLVASQRSRFAMSGKRLEHYRPSNDEWEKRVDGILGNSRRQHYVDAAVRRVVRRLCAQEPCVQLLSWATDLRQQYWRRHAFRGELARACESLGVLVPS